MSNEYLKTHRVAMTVDVWESEFVPVDKMEMIGPEACAVVDEYGQLQPPDLTLEFTCDWPLSLGTPPRTRALAHPGVVAKLRSHRPTDLEIA